MNRSDSNPHRHEIQLPECGMFVGSGIMNSMPNYLVCSGRTHTTWVPQIFSPIELLDRILEDNQGNLVQYWGFDGGISPTTIARHYGLEEIGLIPPAPDWEKPANLLVSDWIDLDAHRDRNGAGVLRFIEESRKRGIYVTLLYTEAEPRWSLRFAPVGGPFYIGYDFGERYTFGLDETHLNGTGLETVNLQTLADDLIGRVRDHVEERRANGWGPIMATSSNFHLDYEIAAGVDIPVVEDFAFQQLNLSSGLSRGLVRQYGLQFWGSHLAHEHYSWIPYASPYKFPLLRASMYQKYMAGSKAIINESGGWYLEAQLTTDSPMFNTPRVELGSIRQRDPYRVAPYVKEAQKTYGEINYHSPTARAYRKEISDFYDFVKTNDTPKGQPETPLALVKGHLDLGGERFRPNQAIAGMYTLAERNPRWYSGQPERSWDIACEIFFPRPQVLGEWHNLFLSGTPYGQVDVTSFVNDRIDADFLNAQYKALLFTGWNTASDKQYETLLRYVENGGTLFLATPHLSTNRERAYADFTRQELINGGDFSELCGLKVKGKGRRFYWATAPDRKGELGFGHPRRFGILSVCMGEIEITRPGVESLAVDDEEMAPVLLRHRRGAGTVYFLNTWAYPGATDADYGPGAHVGSPGLVGYVYRHIARQNRGRYWITDDRADAGHQCRHIAWSYFPEAEKLCLHNIDFDHPRRAFLHHGEEIIPFELAPGEFRLMDTPLRATAAATSSAPSLHATFTH